MYGKMPCQRIAGGTIRATPCGLGYAQGPRPLQRKDIIAHGYKVELEHNGEVTVLDVPEDESILSVALEQGLELPHDCKLGVCMNCAARLVRYYCRYNWLNC